MLNRLAASSGAFGFSLLRRPAQGGAYGLQVGEGLASLRMFLAERSELQGVRLAQQRFGLRGSLPGRQMPAEGGGGGGPIGVIRVENALLDRHGLAEERFGLIPGATLGDEIGEQDQLTGDVGMPIAMETTLHRHGVAQERFGLR